MAARRPKCPNCGEPLTLVKDADAQTCPFLCQPCARGWWRAEIDAAELWDPATRDFGDATPVVLAACDQELAEAGAG